MLDATKSYTLLLEYPSKPLQWASIENNSALELDNVIIDYTCIFTAVNEYCSKMMFS